MLPRDLTSLLDSVKNKAIAAAGPAAAAAAAAASGAAGCPQNCKHSQVLVHRLRNTKTPCALKDGTTSKNMLPRGLTSLLDSGKNKAIAAAGPAAAAAAAPAAAVLVGGGNSWPSGAASKNMHWRPQNIAATALLLVVLLELLPCPQNQRSPSGRWAVACCWLDVPSGFW